MKRIISLIAILIMGVTPPVIFAQKTMGRDLVPRDTLHHKIVGRRNAKATMKSIEISPDEIQQILVSADTLLAKCYEPMADTLVADKDLIPKQFQYFMDCDFVPRDTLHHKIVDKGDMNAYQKYFNTYMSDLEQMLDYADTLITKWHNPEAYRYAVMLSLYLFRRTGDEAYWERGVSYSIDGLLLDPDGTLEYLSWLMTYYYGNDTSLYSFLRKVSARESELIHAGVKLGKD